MAKVRKVRTKPCKGYMYRVIGYDAQGFQVGHYDVQTLHQALYAQDVLEVKKGASAAVIYNKDGEELGGRNLDILRTLKRGQEK